MIPLLAAVLSMHPTHIVLTPPVTATDPTLAYMGRLVGGKWITEGRFVAEFTYEWRIPGKAIRGLGVIAKGTPQELPAESLYGWDPEKKTAYYVDFHGHDTVYKGDVRLEDGKAVGEFQRVVGPAEAIYRFTAELPHDDTLISTLYAKQGDKWVKVHALTFKRHRSTAGPANHPFAL